jgi:hypothetical protein
MALGPENGPYSVRKGLGTTETGMTAPVSIEGWAPRVSPIVGSVAVPTIRSRTGGEPITLGEDRVPEVLVEVCQSGGPQHYLVGGLQRVARKDGGLYLRVGWFEDDGDGLPVDFHGREPGIGGSGDVAVVAQHGAY